MPPQIPRISVIIPTYERPEQLAAAVASVKAQTEMGTAFSVELIIVDDASPTPQGRDLVGETLTLKVERHDKNQGPAAARNTGVAIATGDYIAFLDSDDIWRPEKLARQVAVAAPLPADGVWAQATGFHYKRSGTGAWQDLIPVEMTTPSDFVRGCRHSPGTTSFLPRRIFDVVGPIDATLDRLEDYDWYVRFGQAGGHLHVVPEILADIDPANNAAPEKVLRAIGQIERKFQAGGMGAADLTLLRSYLQLEKGATLWRTGAHWAATAAVARSFMLAPRARLHLAPITRSAAD